MVRSISQTHKRVVFDLVDTAREEMCSGSPGPLNLHMYGSGASIVVLHAMQGEPCWLASRLARMFSLRGVRRHPSRLPIHAWLGYKYDIRFRTREGLEASWKLSWNGPPRYGLVWEDSCL